MKEKTIYYSDELNDDFAGITRKEIDIDANYNYINHSIFYKIVGYLIHKILYIFSYIYLKIKFGFKIKNKKKLKEVSTNYFLYGNHTQIPWDGFFPSFICKKKPVVICTAANVSLHGTKNLMEMIGAFPIPTKSSGMRNFLDALSYHINKRPVVIYPEAHIWPYANFIRPFNSVSFRYPIKYNKPVFAETVTYQKRRFRKTPKITIYIDGPFFPDLNLSLKEATSKLRNEVYNSMKNNSEKYSLYAYIKYIKKENI